MRHISKYEDLLNEDKGRDTLAELKEMADMEMWRAGAAVRSLRPENN